MSIPVRPTHGLHAVPRRTALLTGTVLVGIALAACEDQAVSATGTNAADTASAASAPGTAQETGSTAAPEIPAKTASLTQTDNDADQSGPEWVTGGTTREPSSDAALIVSDFRTGQHEDYDRVVVELSGPGTPGWNAMWVDEATTQGKGDPIVLPGEHLLVVYGTGATMPITPEQQAEALSTGVHALEVGGAAVAGVDLDLTFESQYQVTLGTHSQDHRIFALENPTRLVIDVKHPDA